MPHALQITSSRRSDSNRRTRLYKRRALPTELLRHRLMVGEFTAVGMRHGPAGAYATVTTWSTPRTSETCRRRGRVPRLHLIRASSACAGQAPDVPRRDRPFRRCTDGGRLPRADLALACPDRCQPPRGADAQQPARPHSLRRGLRGRARRYRRTSRVFWCVTIFRFTRWSALSIVFVSHSSFSAMSSYDAPSR